MCVSLLYSCLCVCVSATVQQYSCLCVCQDEAVEEKATEVLGAEVMAKLDQANWKERLSGMETATSAVRRMTRDMIPCQVIVRTIARKPGLKDNNFQVHPGFNTTVFVAPSKR